MIHELLAFLQERLLNRTRLRRRPQKVSSEVGGSIFCPGCRLRLPLAAVRTYFPNLESHDDYLKSHALVFASICLYSTPRPRS